MKVTFTMFMPEPKKHSTRFYFQAFEGPGIPLEPFKPSIYVPKPLAEHCQRIKVTIEELD